MKSIFKELAGKYPDRDGGTSNYSCFINELSKQFATAGVEAEYVTIPRYNFQWTVSAYLILALLGSAVGFLSPLSGDLITLIIAILVIREYCRPYLAKLHPQTAQNLYFTIPARSKETQKLVIISSFATDQAFPKPGFLTVQGYLLVVSALFLTIPLLNAYVYFNHTQHLVWLVLIPTAAIIWFTFFATRTRSTQNWLENYAALADLKALLLKARPLSTTVTFALTGTRAMNSGILALSETIKKGPKLTYIVNLISSSGSGEAKLKIITAEGSPLTRRSDPTLVELLKIVAEEKQIAVSEGRISATTDVFPLLLSENKVVSVENSRATDPSSIRDLRELLAGLIRKLEH